MKQHYTYIVLILLVFSPQKAFSQKYVQDYITDENINTFTDWRDLGGARKLRMNKNWHLSLIKKIDHYEKYDSIELVKFIDSLASLKMNETFHFLTDLCCRYIDYRNKNAFTRMAWILNHYGGPQALNKYYLKDSIQTQSKDLYTIHAEVYYAIRDKYGRMMESSVYLKKYIPPIPPPPLPKQVAKQLTSRIECDSALKINDINVNDISSPWQILSLNRELKTRTDSIVARLLDPVTPTDSLQMIQLVDELIGLKTEASNCVAFTLLFRPIVIHDLNYFNQLSGTLSFYGGYYAVNKHYLNYQVDTTLDYYDFTSKVYLQMLTKMPECYYCKPKTSKQMMKMRMDKVNVSKMDRKILKIIDNHGNLRKFGGFQNYHLALDTILKDVLKLEGIEDATYDYCRTKICIYPGYTILGVRFTVDSVTIDRCYHIQLGYSNSSFFAFGYRIPFIRKPEKLRGNELFSKKEWAYCEPNFIEEEREICNPQIEIEE